MMGVGVRAIAMIGASEESSTRNRTPTTFHILGFLYGFLLLF